MNVSELVWRILVALLLPPLGIIGLPKVGCGTLLLMTLLTLLFWVPGQVVSILVIVKEYDRTNP